MVAHSHPVTRNNLASYIPPPLIRRNANTEYPPIKMGLSVVYWTLDATLPDDKKAALRHLFGHCARTGKDGLDLIRLWNRKTAAHRV